MRRHLMDELSTLSRNAFEIKNILPNADFSKLDHVHNLILSRLTDVDPSLSGAASYHFKTPGKMLRAKMAMGSASSTNISFTAALHWATSIEILHNASLIHDDICDGDKQRRGQPSVWMKFGRNTALTLGDWLIALSFELAAEAAEISNTPRLVSILAKHMATTTAGEAMEFQWNGTQTWDAYLRIAADKTAPLLTAPIQGVTVMAGDNNSETAISNYFRDLGKAYQISNDILNFKGIDGAKLIAGDLARRAPNAVTVCYVETLNAYDRIEFSRWYNSVDKDELVVWRNRIINSGAIGIAGARMLNVLDNAEKNVSSLPLNASEVITPVHTIIKRACALSV